MTIDGLAFQLTEDGKTLQAIFTPVETKQPIDLAQLRLALAEQDFATLLVAEQALAELIAKYDTASEPFTLAIGERRDGHVAVTIAADRMSASVTIAPPVGGRAADRQQVLDALKAAGVVSGILDAEIDAAVARGQVEEKTVARGRAPVHGSDTVFQSLMPEAKERRPVMDDHGMIDYRNLGLFVSARIGTPLMRRIPATPGVPGKDVLGAAIPADPGKDASFAPGLKGTALAADDVNVLVAAIAGQPVLVANGVMVEPTLTVENIDLSTGNLDFEGTLNIAGDVKAGMKIRASGDVIIGGTVEAAEVYADGDIIIKGGIIGHGRGSSGHADEDSAGASHPQHDTARIHSGGSVSAHFIENAVVEAGNCIIVDELALQSELTAINQVVVGKEGSKKGHIVGGVVRATLQVQAIIVGSPAGIRTTIEVGVNPLLQSKLRGLAKQLQQKEKLKEELTLVVVYGKGNPQRISPELLQKTERTCESLQLDIATLNQEMEALQTQMDLAADARVVIGQKVYGGVQIRIGDKIRQIDDERSYGTFRLVDAEVFFGSV
ncbi:MAG: DUF342 domain-containing protein [Nitrosomonadales bacterium]|nr:MAG: DUF342 domain-containing protein [Nitrosomonadales bacterium]